MIEQRTIERVMAAVNIVDVIGDFYELKKAGLTEWMCLCPFHADRHMGSFKVSSRKNIYTCFSCGASGDAVKFLMEHEGLTYPEAIAWLGAKYGIPVEGSAKYYTVRKCVPRPQLPPLPELVLPRQYVRARMTWDDNVWVTWLRSLPWDVCQRSRIDVMLRNYAVGTAKDGRTIWWLIDDQGDVRTGKLMKYQSDGHRDKSVNPYWIHNTLAAAGKIDIEKYEVSKPLFGMHLLDLCPDATVNIVESEKTAVFMAVAYGQMQRSVWMASGGKGMLTKEKLIPMIREERYIVLYPDRDGVEEWEEFAKRIGYERLKVNKEPVTAWATDADGPKADIADVLVRWMGKPIQGVKTVGEVVEDCLEQMINKNEGLMIMVDGLNLKEVK